jgi:flagellar hook-associated protein 1 FlgK
VLQGTLLAGTFNDLSSRLDDARRAADAQARSSIDQINSLAQQISELNAAILNANGADTENLKDQQSVALKSLAEIADVSVVLRADGASDVSIGQGRAIVVGGNQYVIDATPSGISGFVSLSLGGTDITSEISRGRLAGFLQARDSLIPGYQARLDDLAFGVAQQVNAVHQTGTDLNGATGNNFFAPLAGAAGAAAAIAVDAGVAGDSDLVAASQTGAAGDNGIAKAIASLRDARGLTGSATFSDAWGQLVYRVGSDTATARAQQQSRHEVVNQVGKLLDQVEGVSLDEEAALMLRFQRGYEANAKYFSAIESVLTTLMNMVNS